MRKRTYKRKFRSKYKKRTSKKGKLFNIKSNSFIKGALVGGIIAILAKKAFS